MRQRLIAICIAVMLSGCAGLDYREGRVDVRIVELQLVESTLMEQRFLVRLRLQNHYQRALSVNGISFDLELNDKAFASGVSNQTILLPAFGEGTLELKLSSTIFGLIRQLQSVQELEHKPFRYQISGRLNISDGIFSVPFENKGEIDLRAPAGRPQDGI